MSDREYLRSLGFTVGERGRFSKDMTEALANRKAANDAASYADACDILGIPTPAAPVRAAQELYGVTKHGAKVGFIMCSRCSEHMMWCECPDGVMAPDNVAVLTGASKDLARIHPRMVQLTTTI